MPSSIDRSAPPENASLPEVTTTPLIAASAEVCFTISSSSVIVVSSSTFIERPGISHVTSAMPSASVSTLKFLKAMMLLPIQMVPLFVFSCSARALRNSSPFPRKGEGVIPLYPFDDGGGAHAAADAQRDQRGRFVAALEFVEHGAQNHRAGGAERMAERDRPAVDVDLGVVDVEGLHIAQHHRGKRLVQFEQIDVRQLHAGPLQ